MAEEPRTTEDGEPLGRSPSADRRSDDASTTAAWHRMAGVGIEFVVAVGLFAALGWWLDGKCGTSPWLLIAGSGLGFAVGLRSMMVAARRMMK